MKQFNLKILLIYFRYNNKIINCVLLFLIFTSNIISQTNNDLLTPSNNTNKGEKKIEPDLFKDETEKFNEKSESESESIKDLLKNDRDSYIKKILIKAEGYYFQKKFNVALKLFEQVIQKDPDNLLAYRYAGDISLIQNNYEEAINYFEIAREISNEPEIEWLRLCQAYILIKNYKKAFFAANQSLNINPDLYKCHFYLGIIYLNGNNNKKKAIEEWEIYGKNIFGEEKEKIQKAIDNLKKRINKKK